MAKIHIHPSLARFTDHQNEFILSAETVSALIPSLCAQYPSLKASIVNANGELTPYVNIYINGKNLSQYTPERVLTEHDKVDLVASLVGG